MKHWHFYSLADGLLLASSFSTNDKNFAGMIASNTPDGAAPIEGHFDRFTQRVDLETKQVIEYQARAPEDIESEQKDAAARAAIVAIENDQARAVREALIELLPDGSPAKAKLVQIDDAIVAQRADLIRTPSDLKDNPAVEVSAPSSGAP